MTNSFPHMSRIVVWPLIIVWLGGWLGAFVASVWFLVSIVRFALAALS